MTLADVLDSAPCYVPGYGETTVGQVRSSAPQGIDLMEATCRMWEDVVTRNLCRLACDPGASLLDIRAFHAARYTSAQMPRASS